MIGKDNKRIKHQTGVYSPCLADVARLPTGMHFIRAASHFNYFGAKMPVIAAFWRGSA
jgi:hypothetical protein